VPPGPGIDYIGTDHKMRLPEHGRADRIELRFPEFGDQRYRPANGTAIVFSSSLLHEALHMISGRRLVVLGFLFGDH
jgi:hypothetical protein